MMGVLFFLSISWTNSRSVILCRCTFAITTSNSSFRSAYMDIAIEESSMVVTETRRDYTRLYIIVSKNIDLGRSLANNSVSRKTTCGPLDHNCTRFISEIKTLENRVDRGKNKIKSDM